MNNFFFTFCQRRKTLNKYTVQAQANWYLPAGACRKRKSTVLNIMRCFQIEVGCSILGVVFRLAQQPIVVFYWVSAFSFLSPYLNHSLTVVQRRY